MKSMLAIAQLLTRQKLRKIDILSDEFLSTKQSKFRDLYDALQDGTIRNDREAAQHLYGATSSDPRYRQLKSRLRKRMLNTLFFVDQNRPHRSSFDQTYHNCQRDWSLINILIANGAIDPACDMAKSLLTCSVKYGFSELTVQVARFLAQQCAAQVNSKGLEKLEELIDTHSQLHNLEIRSERVLRKLKMNAAQHHAFLMPSPSQEVVLHDLCSQLEALAALTSSPMVQYDWFEGQCLSHAAFHNWDGVIAAVDQAIAYGEQSPRQVQAVREQLLRKHRILAAASMSQQSRQQPVLVNLLRSKANRGSEEWLELRRLQTAALLNAGLYEEAMTQCAEVMKLRSFKDLNVPEQEMWTILQSLAVVLSESDTTYHIALSHPDAKVFLNKEATIGGEYQRLNAWRLLTKAAMYRQQRNLEAAGQEISKLRELTIRKLDKKRDAPYIALAQVLYRIERNDFSPYLDRVAERYQAELDDYLPALAIDATCFEPVLCSQLLAVFGVRSMSLAA